MEATMQQFGSMEMEEMKDPSSSLVEFQPSFPARNRTLQNQNCVLLIILVLVIMTSMCVYCFREGDPKKFRYEYDSWGNVCGRKNNAKIPGVSLSGMDMSNRTFVLRTGTNNIRAVKKPDILLYSSPPAAAVLCVNKCPTAKITDCRKFVEENGYYVSETIIREYVCVMLLEIILSQTTELNRCIPRQLLQISSESEKYFLITSWDYFHSLDKTETEENIDFKKKFFYEFIRYFIGQDYVTVILLFLVSILVSTSVIMAATLFPVYCAYIIVAVHIVASIFFLVELWVTFVFLKGHYVKKEQLTAIQPSVQVDSELKKQIDERFTSSVFFYTNNGKEVSFNEFENMSLDISVSNTTNSFSLLTIDGYSSLTVFLIILIFLMLFVWTQTLQLILNRKKIFFLVKTIENASYLLLSTPYLLIITVVELIILTSIWAIHYTVLTYLFTISSPIIDDKGLVDYIINQSIFSFVTLNLLSIWFWNFAATCSTFILSHVVYTRIFYQACKKYNINPQKISHRPHPLKYLITNHLGTVTVASVAVTLVQPTKPALYYVFKKLKRVCKENNTLLNSFESVLNQVNRNVIIYSLIFGTGFRESAEKCYVSFKHNNVQEVSNAIYYFISGIRTTIIGFSTVLMFVFFRLLPNPHQLLGSFIIFPWFAIITFIDVAHCVYNLYNAVLDTVLVCFCNDLEQNNGENRPYYVPDNFRNSISDYLKSRETATCTNQILPVKSDANEI